MPITDHDLTVLACRPRDLDLTDFLDAAIAAMTSVYSGSVESTCGICQRPVHIGPNQLTVHQANPGVMIACFRCVAVFGGDPDALDIRSLGNPEKF